MDTIQELKDLSAIMEAYGCSLERAYEIYHFNNFDNIDNLSIYDSIFKRNADGM